jgi:hypothetical protein
LYDAPMEVGAVTRAETGAETRALRREVERLEGEVQSHQQTIASLEDRVKILQDFAGEINAERARKGSIRRRIERLRAPAFTLSVQYPPRPLRVPRSYSRVRPPDPAPRITVVTPSFNHGAYIERTIRSVINQGYPNLEYVVQDGGSTDRTGEILARHAHELARVVSQADHGQADAINRGFARTTGEIMAYLNSDDLLLPGSLASVASFFARHPEVDAVYSHRLVIDAADRDIGMWMLPPHRDWVLTLADYVPQETLFWRRRAWEQAGGCLNTDLHFALDWDLLLRFMANQANLVRLPRFLGAFRTHPKQKTLASTDLGHHETASLRDHWHGYEMSPVEVTMRLRQFYRRHLMTRYLHRLRGLVPTRRIEVLTATPVARQPCKLPEAAQDREREAAPRT